jgi:hypothetical protein
VGPPLRRTFRRSIERHFRAVELERLPNSPPRNVMTEHVAVLGDDDDLPVAQRYDEPFGRSIERHFRAVELERLPNSVPRNVMTEHVAESLLANLAIRRDVVWRVDVTLVDLTFWHEFVDFNCSSALDVNGLYFLILDDHVLALSDVIAAHHIVPRDDLASLGIDVLLLLQSVARFPIDPIEAHFFAQRRDRIERNRARDQRKPELALPVRTRRHWILLNNMRQAKLYRKNLANA